MGECYQCKAIGQCSKGDSCSVSHDRASGNRCDQRQRGRSSSLAPEAQTQTDGKKPLKGSGLRGESPSGQGGRIACRHLSKGMCTNPSCIIGTLPCVSITSVNEDANMAINAESDTLRLMGSTVKSQSKVVGKDQLSY